MVEENCKPCSCYKALEELKNAIFQLSYDISSENAGNLEEEEKKELYENYHSAIKKAKNICGIYHDFIPTDFPNDKAKMVYTTGKFPTSLFSVKEIEDNKSLSGAAKIDNVMYALQTLHIQNIGDNSKEWIVSKIDPWKMVVEFRREIDRCVGREHDYGFAVDK